MAISDIHKTKAGIATLPPVARNDAWFLSFFLKSITWPARALRWLLLARPIHFTRFGVFYILFALAVGAAAINTGNNLLYLMLGLLLGFIIVSGFLSDSCLWGLDAALEPGGDFYAGQAAEWDLCVRKGWFPAILVNVELLWEFSAKTPSPLRGEGGDGGEHPQPPTRTLPRKERGDSSKVLFFWIPRYGLQRARVTLTPSHRGRIYLKSLRYSTRFPFGLFEKSHQTRKDLTWVVLPRIYPLPLEILRVAGRAYSDHPVTQKGAGTTPFDVREYYPGDPSKRIHWKSSAKRGQLMVSEMEEESDLSQQVVITQWPQESTPPGSLEEFISFVASLVFTLSREGKGVGLMTPGAAFSGDPSRSQLKRILTYLALVEPAKEITTASPTTDRCIDALSLWERFPSIR